MGKRLLTLTVLLTAGCFAFQSEAPSPQDQLDAAYKNLKDAEAKKDADGVKKWSDETSKIARQIVATAKPDDDAAKKQSVDYAKQMDTYSEYALFAAAAQAGDPAKTIDLSETLIQRNPKSQYVPQLIGAYLKAIQQSQGDAKAGDAAERMLAIDPNNEDALLIATNSSFKRKANTKTIEYANKLVEVMNSKPKPAGVSDADWDKKKNSMLGLGYWFAGVTYGTEGKYADADKALRSALPHIEGNSQLLAIGLFHLGLANYKMGTRSHNKKMIQDALRYSEQSEAIRSPYQAQAQANVRAIKAQLGQQ